MTTKQSKKTMIFGALSVEPLANGKIRIGVGSKKTDVEYKDLWGAIFLNADKEAQDAMMPVRKTPMMVFSRKYVIEARNDIKKGDKIVFWGEVNVEQTVVDAIAKQHGVTEVHPQLPEEEITFDSLERKINGEHPSKD